MEPVNASAALLSGEDLARRYGDVMALAATSVEVHAGDIVAIVGANGCGKSTLLRALAGLADGPGSSGVVRRRGAPLARDEGARVRAFVPQRPEMPGEFTAREVVRLGRFARGHDDSAVERALASVGLSARAGLPVHQLSGGERQRVAVARALAQVDGADGAVLLLDEPFGGIDPGEVARIVASLRALAQGGAVVLSLHDAGLARAIATRAIVLKSGRVQAAGLADAVLQPAILSEAYAHPIDAVSGWLAPRLSGSR